MGARTIVTRSSSSGPPRRFENVLSKLRKPVEEQDPQMREGDLAGMRGGCRPDQSGHGDRVVRRPKGADGDQAAVGG